MNLIYVNEIGSDYKGQKQYEFIFSDYFEDATDAQKIYEKIITVACL